MNRDQADRFFRCQRSQPFLDLARGQPKTPRAHQIDADEIAILGATGIGLGDVEFAAGLFLVDRDQPSAAIGGLAKNAEHAGLGVIDDLDDAAAIDAAFGIVEFLDSEQRAVADTCRRARLWTPRNMNADLRRLAAFDLIPFG